MLSTQFEKTKIRLELCIQANGVAALGGKLSYLDFPTFCCFHLPNYSQIQIITGPAKPVLSANN